MNTILIIKCPRWQCGGMVLTVDLLDFVECETSKHLNEQFRYVKDYKTAKLRKLIQLIAMNIEYSNMKPEEVWRILALNRSQFADDFRQLCMLKYE